MADRVRIFVGSTELEYASAKLIKTNDQIVDSGSFAMEADASVTNSSTIQFRQTDGTTVYLSGTVQELKEIDTWTIKTYSAGYELQNIRIEQVYTNQSPEAIVQDIIDNNTTNLTYASTGSSGVTIAKYLAKGYAIDIIKDMMQVLEWQIRIDASNNFYFEPEGNVNNGVTFTNGTNIQIDSWDEDKSALVNHVRVVGGFENYNTTETVSGTGTTFSLSHKPNGSMKVTIASVEQDPDTYTVNAEDEQVVFNSSQTNPTFIYSYDRPIVIEDQNDSSIALHGEIFKEITVPFLNTTSDARRYASKYLESFSLPLAKAKGTTPGVKFDVEPGEIVTVIDNTRSKTETLVVSKVTIDVGPSTKTVYEFGPRDFEFFDWQAGAQDRIKKLERQFTNEDLIVFSRLFKSNLTVTLSVSTTFEQNSPNDSFWFDHQTLGRLRDDLNFEADCSNNALHGTWNGSGIGGSQYTTSGYRLSAGQFNGSDNYINVADDSSLDFTGDFSIALAIKVSPLPSALTYLMNKWDGTDGYAIRIASDNRVELIYSNGGADSTLKATTALSDNTWQHVVFTKSGTNLTVYINGTSDNTGTGGSTVGTNNNDLEAGRYSSNYFTGDIDELRLYDSTLTSTDASDLSNKIQRNNDMVLYWSMDNPKSDDRSTARVPVT